MKFPRPSPPASNAGVKVRAGTVSEVREDAGVRVRAGAVPEVRAEKLCVEFGVVRALENLSFALRPGSLTAVIGPNGSGKTTLLMVLAGLLQPSSGSIGRRSSVAYMPHQNGHGAPIPLIVAEVLVMGLYRRLGNYRRMSAAERERLTLAAERLEVADLMRRQFSEISSGQRQRVLMAQTLLQQADLVLLDEPITGLDLASRRRIMDVMSAECGRGAAVVFSTHHLDEARHGDQVLMLDNRLVAKGPPEDVLTKENLETLYGERVIHGAPDCDHPADRLLVLDEHAHGRRLETAQQTTLQ